MMKKISYVTLLSCVTASFALEGGPSQPDYAQFEPSGMTDMVSMQSGDFSYQIPLSDIPSPYGNYPLSLSYHAGISPQQEASWVGLGWSLNPGSINRDVRGVPDDQFHGGTLGFIYQYSATQVWSVDLGYSIGAFSVGQNFSSDGSVGFSATVGPKIAGVAGVGFTVGTDAVGVEASVGYGNAKLNAGLMFSTKDGKPNAHVGASIGVAGASLGAQVSTGGGASARVGFGNSNASVGLSVSANGVSATASVGKVSMSKSKNGASVSVGGGTLSVSNSATDGNSKTSTAGFAVVIPTNIGVFSFGFSQTTFEYWMRSATSEYLYGYIYQAGPAIDVKDENDLDGIPDAEATSRLSDGSIPWKWTMKGRTLESMGREDMSPAYDMYSVSSEGASGSFRPFAREKHQLYKFFSNKNTADMKSLESYSTILENDDEGWPLSNEFKKSKSDLLVEREDSTYNDYAYCMTKDTPCSIYGMYQTNFRNRGNRLVFNSDSTQFEERGGMRFLFVGEGAGYYESDDIDSSKTRDRSKISSNLLKKTVNSFEYALYGSKKVEPIFEDNSPIGKLQGFTVTTADGSKYIFKQPIRSYLKVDYSINREKGVPVFADKSSSKYDNFWSNLLDGVMAVAKWAFKHMNPAAVLEDLYDFVFSKGHLDEKCDPDGKDNKKDKKEDYYYSYTVNMNPHATQWLLSEVQGADYVKVGNRDIGYNVKFTYTKPSVYRWRTPYARPDVLADEVPNFRSPRNAFTPEGCDSRMYQASFGVKEYVYLESIETSTHRVVFNLNDQERVDGKGWEVGANSIIPILVQTTLGLELNFNGKGEIKSDKVPNMNYGGYSNPFACELNYWKQNISVRPKYIYFNTPLPEKILSALYKNNLVSIEGLEKIDVWDYKGKLDEIRKDKEIIDCGKELDEKVDFLFSDLKFGKQFSIVKNSFERTKGKESRYGLYRLEINSDFVDIPVYYLNKSVKDSIQKMPGGGLIAIGENGDLVQNPYIDWSKFIFANTTDVDTMENQMRYLKKITYYRKAGNDTIKYKEYDFNYDYSLQPKTLNSYCKGRYPDADSVDQIVRSPDSVGVDICKTDTTSRSLYGKLTLRSITETGFQNGKKASLPPFKFSYNAPAATPTRISTKNGWIDYFQENKGEEDSASVYGAGYFEGFKDVDATILASSNTTDEYGFWSNTANVENHKIDQSFADYGAAAWSLNKVVDPTGGNLEVEYERDRYGAGVDFSQDKRTVEFSEFNQCSKYGILSYQDNLCIKVGTLYWRDQCLGPRAAYWDHDKPDGATGDGFDYLDSLQIKAENRSHLFYNLMVQLKTKVKCGMFGWGRCTRHRNVAVIGDGELIELLQPDDTTKILVVNRDYNDIHTAIQKAANKINEKQKWSENSTRNGYLWTGKSLNQVKAGDLRVTKLTRHDIGLQSLTSYEYDDGELAQLADSSYTTVLGSRFYPNKNSYAIPDVHLDPISRIVGLDDDDLMFVPGARISYPKVTVKNSSSDTSNYNGTTEFYYVTPETGIPEEYVDSATRAVLKPFVKINLLFVSRNDNDDYDNGRLLRITLLDSNSQKLAGTETLRIIAFPDERTPLYFYSDDILSAKYVKVEKMDKGESDPTYQYRQIVLWDSTSVVSGMNTPLTKFNEYSLVVYGGKEMNDTLDKVEFTWKRRQKDGFYPILYKQVVYQPGPINIRDASDNGYNGKERDSIVDFEKNITYHDLTAFLGQNYKTVFKRGSGNNSIVVKMDSSFYSTVVPDVVGIDDSLKYKVGRQVEKWSSEQKMQCAIKKSGKIVPDSLGVDDVCKKQNLKLYIKRSSGSQIQKDFTYIRYPAFQIGSVNFVGHDNQTQNMDVQKFGKTELHNYEYDPLTGSPTATLATVSLGSDALLRKYTKMYPYYAMTDYAKKKVPVADSMFLRNMLTQNYKEEVYTDTLKNASTVTSLKAGADADTNLRSFSVTPYRFVPDTVYGSGANVKLPIVSWGTYTTKGNPQDLAKKSNDFADTSHSHPSWPSLYDYSGTDIIAIDSNLKVTETKDVLDRSMTTVFSKDGMFQLSLFFPAKREEVGAILPYQDSVHASKNCSPLHRSVENGAILVGSNKKTVACTVSVASGNIIKEYRMWSSANGWKTDREFIAASSGKDTIELTIPAGGKLNYFRVYPEKAESKSFIYDKYGNMIQSIAEDNTSTYYEYDPLGNLVQSRNDDGVSFKAHHREYMNDTTTQKVMGE